MAQTQLDPQVRTNIEMLITEITNTIRETKFGLFDRFQGSPKKLAQKHRDFIGEAERLLDVFDTEPHTDSACAGLHFLLVTLRKYKEVDDPNLQLFSEAQSWEEFINSERRFDKMYGSGWKRKRIS